MLTPGALTVKVRRRAPPKAKAGAVPAAELRGAAPKKRPVRNMMAVTGYMGIWSRTVKK